VAGRRDLLARQGPLVDPSKIEIKLINLFGNSPDGPSTMPNFGTPPPNFGAAPKAD
jgi:hypothetical protein